MKVLAATTLERVNIEVGDIVYISGVDSYYLVSKNPNQHGYMLINMRGDGLYSGTHNSLYDAVEFLISKNFIYFSDFAEMDGYIEIGNEITKPQIEFIKSNYMKMSKDQRKPIEERLGGLY